LCSIRTIFERVAAINPPSNSHNIKVGKKEKKEGFPVTPSHSRKPEKACWDNRTLVKIKIKTPAMAPVSAKGMEGNSDP